MSRQEPRLAAVPIEGVPPAPPADPLALVYHPCEGGCGTTLACSPYAGPVVPPFRCVRCTAGKPVWQKDPPHILAPGDLVPVEEEEAREYLRDADGIPLPGQVVPLNLAAYLAQDRPLDKHTVMTMLVEFAVRASKGRVNDDVFSLFGLKLDGFDSTGTGELAWQLLHTASAEHRGDERLRPIAVRWVTEQALDTWSGSSLVHDFAGAGDLSKLTSLVAAGVPVWKMMVVNSADGESPFDDALKEGPANLPAVMSFFLDAARWLSGPHPLPLTPEMDVAAGKLPGVLSHAMWSACEFDRVPEVVQLLAFPGVDPSWADSFCLLIAAGGGHTSIVQLLLADGRADPEAESQGAICSASRNGHATVAALLADPRVDPTEREGWALKAALKRGRAAVVALLKADPRMAPWVHLTAESPEVNMYNW